jgi:hypothetical protein
VAKKKYDPLWEIVDEKVALQGAEPDVDCVCPHCNVRVHLGTSIAAGERVECGLCGGVCEVVARDGVMALEPREAQE